jgi:hypothetical protein
MAKKKQAAIEDAPVSDVSIPTIPESHKDPAQRTHLWERPARVDEKPAEAPPHADYKYELPRWLHKDGESKYVTTPEACDAALKAGWEIHPSAPKHPGGAK